ncbi:MAG: FitA-like ribbon-helix-helix domain-containing protein [Allosphingosinicella sp.]
MAQVLIRNIDDDLLDDYREAAKRNDRSLEAELREALRMMRPMSAAKREAYLQSLAEIRAMTPNVPQTPAEQLVREDRDGLRDV